MNADGVITLAEIIFLAVFSLLVFGVPSIVAIASYSTHARLATFDMSTLWTHQGRVDKFAVIILGTWWVHTCSMILWALLRTVATQDYITYMGWAIPIMLKMWAPQNDAAPPPPDKPA